MGYIDVLTNLVRKSIVKVLKVNLETDIYEVEYLSEAEPTIASNYLKDWIDDFVINKYVHPDFADLLSYTINSEYLKKVLSYKPYVHLKINRKYRDGVYYRSNIVTVLPIDKENVYIIVYDMNGI